MRQHPEGGKNAEARQQVELKLPQFDAVAYPKASEFHALRVGNVLSSYQWVHFQAQRLVPSPTSALELYGYEAPQAQTKLESCEACQDSR